MHNMSIHYVDKFLSLLVVDAAGLYSYHRDLTFQNLKLI